MNFQHYDLGHINRGDIVVVELGYAANVLLLDNTNYQHYQQRRQHQYYGGYYKHSPARIEVPRSGRWHVAIDLGGNAGRVKSSVRVIPC